MTPAEQHPASPLAVPTTIRRCAFRAVLTGRNSGWTALTLVFGLLLWAKLLLVTGHPRTAIAAPPAATAPGGGGATARPAAPASGIPSR